MKKYLLGIIAVVLAVGFSAFTAEKGNESKLTNYYWYDLSGGSLGFGSQPNNGCTAIGTDCARGFLVEPDDPTVGIPDQTRAFN